MALGEKIKSIIESVQFAADAIGKALWVFLVLFVATAIGTGHPALLGAIRDRLILVGITSLKTPFGDIDPKQIGQLDAASRILGINAARASELADGAGDTETKQKLQAIANELKEQQHVQLETLGNLASRQKANSAANAIIESNDAEGWIYLGRRSGDKWRPPSFSIDEPAYPVKSGDNLVVKTDTVLYEAIDCKVIDASDAKASTAPHSMTFVKAHPNGIQVAGVPTECPSVGGAATVWAKVKIPAARIVRLMQ